MRKQVAILVGLMVALVAGLMGITFMPAAHAAPNVEQYTDLTAEANCYGACGQGDYVHVDSASHLVNITSDFGSATNWEVNYSGGHWCIQDNSIVFMGISSTAALIDNYSANCNVGGDEWVISCVGAPNYYEFKLQNLHNNEYVDYNGGGVYHADTLIGDVFYDNSHQECS